MENNDKRELGIITNKWFLGKSEFSDIESIRREVFVKELSVNEKEEFDEFDQFAVHAVIYIDDMPAATGRIWYDNKEVKIGKLAVLEPFRGIGIGDLTLRLLLVKTLKTSETISADVERTLINFYSKFGFKAVGEEFIAADKPKIKMTLKIEDFVLPSKCKGH